LVGGDNSVCVFAIESAGSGSNRLLGCRTVRMPTGSPIGSYDRVDVTGPTTARVHGWAIDPDTAASIPVHVYVNGRGVANVVADRPRADVGAAFPLHGPNHGFGVDIGGLVGGDNSVCVFAIESAGSGSNRLLGCRTVHVG
jgi:hypothetical protein